MCSEDDCDNQAYLRGLCLTHNKKFKALGTQCSVEGCSNPVASKGMCHNHYLRDLNADQQCEIAACEQPPISRGLCQTHYRLLLNEGIVCAVEDCFNQAHARGLCHQHYKLSRTENTECSVDGCENRVSARGMCFTHYNSERLSGVICSVDGCEGRATVLNDGHPLCQIHVKRGSDWIIGESGGWDPRAQAVLYLIRDDDVWKYGVALEHALPRRLRDHKWHRELIDLVHGSGAEVMELEFRIKQCLKRKGIACIYEERDGYTESHYRSDYDPCDLEELLALAEGAT